MTENVQIALITVVVGPTVLVLVNWFVTRPQRRAIGRIEAQVANDHVQDPSKVSNLREDMDDKHGIVIETMRAVAASMRAVVRDIGGIRQDIRQLRTDLSKTDSRVDDLETTQERNKL